MRRRRTILLCLLAAFLPALCAGCAPVKEAPKVSEVGFYLDTVITMTAYVEDAQVLKDAMALLNLMSPRVYISAPFELRLE